MSKQQLIINSAANFLGRALGSMANFLVVPIYVRLLGIESYGIVGFVASLQASLSILDFGLAATVNREVARLEATEPKLVADTVATLSRIYIFTALLVFAAMLAITPFFVSHWLNLKEIAPSEAFVCLVLAAAAFSLRWPVAIYNGVMQGSQNQVIANLIYGGMGVVRAAGGVMVLVYVAPRLEAFFGWQVLSSVLELMLTRYFAWRCLPAASIKGGTFTPSILKDLWRFAAGFGLVAAIGTFVSNLDRLLLAKLLPLDQLGLLAMLGTAASILTVCGTSICAASFPRFVKACRASDCRTELGNELVVSVKMVARLVIPGFLIFAFFPKTLLAVWCGTLALPEESDNILRLLALGSLINALGSLFYTAIVANGSMRWLFSANIISLVLLFPLYWFGLPRFGLILAGIGWCLYNTILLSAAVIHCRKLAVLPRVPKSEIGYVITVVALFAIIASLSTKMEASPWIKLSLSGALVVLSIGGTKEVRSRILAQTRKKLAWLVAD